ncbi:MAG: ribosome maturation factor RimP [Tissierellia bacterium]|nr:ribosome maturation factor RimP [Tissierellia bacterium]
MNLNDLKKEIINLLLEDPVDVIEINRIRRKKDIILEVCIDKSKGVTFEDCERVSKILSSFLDEKDPINESYYLEVASAGLDRPLKTTEDLNRHIGEEIVFKKRGAKNKEQGTLVEVKEDIVVVNVNDDRLEINRSDITKITLAF